MSAANSTSPCSFRGARSTSAMILSAALDGSTAKYALATMRSYGPPAPNTAPSRTSDRSTNSTRVTAAVAAVTHNNKAQNNRHASEPRPSGNVTYTGETMRPILSQRQVGPRLQRQTPPHPPPPLGKRRGRDHRRIIRRQPRRREKHGIRH